MHWAMLGLLAAAVLVLQSSALAGQKAADKAETPRDVEFKAELDGSTEKYVEILPPGYDPKKKNDLLIALHGHGSDRWQYIKEERGECKAAREVAAKRGLIFISPDYRAPTSWMGPKAEADLVQIIRDIRKDGDGTSRRREVCTDSTAHEHIAATRDHIARHIARARDRAARDVEVVFYTLGRR